MEGAVAVGPEEKTWIFTPDTAWNKGSYTIRVGTALADLAGNMIDRPFEIDVFERVDQNLNRTTRIPRIQSRLRSDSHRPIKKEGQEPSDPGTSDCNQGVTGVIRLCVEAYPDPLSAVRGPRKP